MSRSPYRNRLVHRCQVGQARQVREVVAVESMTAMPSLGESSMRPNPSLKRRANGWPRGSIVSVTK